MKTSAYIKLSRYCSLRERSEQEVRKKAVGLGMLPGEISKALKQLKKEGFLNESRYVRAYISDQSRFLGWGPHKIGLHLRRAGISGEEIQAALEELPEGYWQELAEKLVEKKRKIIKESDPYKMRYKLYQWLYGRGFSGETISAVIGDLE